MKREGTTTLLEVGAVFGMAKVVESGLRLPPCRSHALRGALGDHAVRIECACGTRKAVRSKDLRQGKIVSCGRHRGFKDGRSSHPRYSTWGDMLQRCENRNHRKFPDYGGRGVKVYGPWHDSAVFLAYLDTVLGARPAGHSLDRIDNDGDYEPGNLRWADSRMQNRNQRKRNG